MIDYAARLKKARSRMAEKNIGLMFLPPGANLFYLTGIRRHENDNTDANAYGDWAVGSYLGLEEGITLTAPRMGGAYFQAEAQGKAWFESVRLILESEDPADVMRQVLSRFDLRGKKVALDNRAWAQSVLAFQQLLPDTEFVLASEVTEAMRMIKEESALDLMRKAGQITDIAFQKALAMLKPGVTEMEVVREIDYQLKINGAEYTSFVTGIRFTGPGQANATVAVGRAGERRLAPGDSITFDFGCVYQGYCSDFGRSAFVGNPPAEYVRIHEIVLRAQREAMQAMKAGQITATQANRVARSVIEAEGYGDNFTHRLGHGIGITVHEEPFLDVVNQTVLQANMTFTVEPSIRIPDRFSNRVEDVVVVTPTGAVSLYGTDHRLYVIS
ncbi:MAG: aminopeptidase P family protein [Chloroflexi bacterium]|nr:aminopeptidase P family protein [Chloroflexota bacterium]